jgi:hypothetical protein
MNDAGPPRRLHPVIPLVMLIKQAPEILVPFVGVVAVARDEGMGVMLLAVGGLPAVFSLSGFWRGDASATRCCPTKGGIRGERASVLLPAVCPALRVCVPRARLCGKAC